MIPEHEEFPEKRYVQGILDLLRRVLIQTLLLLFLNELCPVYNASQVEACVNKVLELSNAPHFVVQVPRKRCDNLDHEQILPLRIGLNFLLPELMNFFKRGELKHFICAAGSDSFFFVKNAGNVQ